MRALMPPWFGTEAENEALTDHLMSLKPEGIAMPADDAAAARLAFAVSCGLCHTPSGYRSLAGSFTGMEADEIDEFLDEAGDLADEMPAYFGPPEQRAALVRYLHLIGTTDEGSES